MVWLGMINNPNGTVGWGLSRNEWVYCPFKMTENSARSTELETQTLPWIEQPTGSWDNEQAVKRNPRSKFVDRD